MEPRQSFAQSLINAGISPTMKKYESVKPRGIYKLFPSKWREAKQMEQMIDPSFAILMNQFDLAAGKQRMEQAKYLREQFCRRDG